LTCHWQPGYLFNHDSKSGVSECFRKAGLRKIRVFISYGRDDKISSVVHGTAVKDSVKSNGHGDVRLEFFEGGHQMDNQEFLKAMA